ncbi:MAG: methylglyoxal synthase [Pseudomonadota bacterium]
MMQQLRVALIAHDAKKDALATFVKDYEAELSEHYLFATGTTGRVILEHCPGLSVQMLKSGPLGGDQQVGSMIATGGLDVLIFFTDPMTAQPHDVDVKALTRLSTLYNLPMACNRATADFLLTSPFFRSGYDRGVFDDNGYAARSLKS